MRDNSEEKNATTTTDTSMTAVIVVLVGACAMALTVALILSLREPLPDAEEPPATRSIREWRAAGHWWVVGDCWGQHHPECPCMAKAEVE